jgi:hypothetical protein
MFRFILSMTGPFLFFRFIFLKFIRHDTLGSKSAADRWQSRRWFWSWFV